MDTHLAHLFKCVSINGEQNLNNLGQFYASRDVTDKTMPEDFKVFISQHKSHT